MPKGPYAPLATALLACRLATGCESTPHSATTAPQGTVVDPAAGVPSDLWLEATVRLGRGVETSARVEERAARFVLLPDGALCASTDRVGSEGRLPAARPPLVRRLAREQMSDLWSSLVAAGFTDASIADTRGNVALLQPDAGEILVTLELHARGERFAFVRRYRLGDEAEPATRRIVRAIASVAWASDEALAESAEVPQRTDLGPDPYARFAPRPASQPAAQPASQPAEQGKAP